MRPQPTSPNLSIPGKQLRNPTRKSSEWTNMICTLHCVLCYFEDMLLYLLKSMKMPRRTLWQVDGLF